VTTVTYEAPPRKRFTWREAESLADIGVFEGQRYELIDGDLIDKSGQKPRHAFTIQLLLGWLGNFVRGGLIRVQLPMEAGGEDREWSEPEPDIAVLVGLKPEYEERHPRGDELMLVVDVGDSSVFRCRAGTKKYRLGAFCPNRYEAAPQSSAGTFAAETRPTSRRGLLTCF
jgi:hypothetical protein